MANSPLPFSDDELQAERWLPCVGYPAYEVSDLGRVRRVDSGRVLKPGTVKSGHQLVVLGRGNSKLIHALVLIAFVGPRPPKHDSCHADGVPGNNRLPNLRWGTRSENVRDSIRHGTFRTNTGWGENSPRAVLSDNDVRRIRAESGTAPHSVIAKRYGVARATVSRIIAGKSRAEAGE